ncbi:gamma-glutamylcyclotransferase family protein [Allokutzneria oryzae]|uniref:Gamma-glutamylcyclotransferase n=1 Tax=Allokutzneria oryzae TaxID=1378989 RepID=A0ABV5ZX11_9PSEU
MPPPFSSFRDSDFPADPYPGARPDGSFLHEENGRGVMLRPGAGSWLLGDSDSELDAWLADRGHAPLAERVPVLVYGSNQCPSKITWLRETLRLPGPAVVLRARCGDLAAVWANGLRKRDGARPATLAAMPGVVETHAVWMATPEQIRVLDVCEGRGQRYGLARVRSGTITLDNGSIVDGAVSYVGLTEIRMPLLRDGEMVRCAEVDQYAALALRGTTGHHGLNVSFVDGVPEPDEWPNRLFVYGTLQPGASAWRLIEPLVSGAGTAGRLSGKLYDTGLGYPALHLGDGSGVPGRVLELRDPAAGLRVLDEYEGEDYRRIRVAVDNGLTAWTYVWTAPVSGMVELASGWLI